MDRQAGPFQNSLEALAQVALRATGAQSYAFFQKSDTAGFHKSGAIALVEYPLQTNGVIGASVVFAFCNEAEALRARPRLNRIAAAIQAIWAAATTERYANLVGRVADLEMRLMDSKIADRARGLLTDESNSDPTEAIARHVEGVLRPTQTRHLLEQVLSELEDEIEERRLLAQAKQIVQSLYSVSEEQAHSQLRLQSRRSRKSLKDVAQQVVADRHLLQVKSA